MEDIDLLDMYLDEAEVPRPRRTRQIRPRPDYMTLFDDVDFRNRFRLKKPSVLYVHNLIKDEIGTATMRNHAVSTLKRLLITLRFLATGSFLIVLGDFGGVSLSTTCRIIEVVTEAIARLRSAHIKFPNDLTELSQAFYNIARFPRVVGAIDCTHIGIISPGGDNAENYRNGNRKGFSLNVQAICDFSLKIMDMVARWPGSAHDQTVFNNSVIKAKLENGDFGNGLLMGDSGYENTSFLFTPFLEPANDAENLFNESQIRTRNVVERCFGVLKNRFPILKNKITVSLNRTQAIIIACAVLHNIAIEANEEDFGYELEAVTPEEQLYRQEIARRNAELAQRGDPRRHLLRDHFAAMLGNAQNIL